tara:strand:+ start:1072 stop:1299 length:228 start_codon:yes stop_codon:yes gene_type:complete
MTLDEQLSRSAKQLRFSQENLYVAVDALNELRDLAQSGSAEMACIDEALGKMGYTLLQKGKYAQWQNPCLINDHR